MNATRKIFYSPAWIVLFALLVRLLYIVVAHSYSFNRDHWAVFEMANLGYSLASGHGFSSPFGGDSGPSAWTAPLYPWILSLCFRIFGIYSHGAAFAILAFNSVCAALTSWTIYRIGRRVFNETVAVWSGWIWAVWPGSIYFSVIWIWETCLSAFLLSWLFMLTLEMEDDDRLRSWVGYGLLWGIVALTNTSALAWLPFSGCWLVYQLHRRGKRYLAPVVVSAVVFWITLTPWLVRNYQVFHQPVFVRADLGVELRIGNNPQAQGWWVNAYHPGNNRVLFERYKQMGEVAYAAQQGQDAREWIVENPADFLVLSLRRCLFFWVGFPKTGLEQAATLLSATWSLLSLGGLILALKRRVHGVFLFVTLLVFYPLIYYITFPTPRYRHAIDPELLVLTVFLISSLLALARGRSTPVGQLDEAKL